jgi:hypothetical protein
MILDTTAFIFLVVCYLMIASTIFTLLYN